MLKKTTIDVEETTLNQIDAIAQEAGISRIGLIRMILRYYLKNKDKIKLV